MLGDVTIKCTFSHISHRIPMWIDMGRDDSTISHPTGVCFPIVKRPITPDEWAAIMTGGMVLLIAFLLWLFVKKF
jgi:hypothetical protein